MPTTSVADPGCLSRIPDPNFFHPGSPIRILSIPDPRSEFFPSRHKSWIRIKEVEYFNPKILFLSTWKYDLGCSSRIRILSFYPSRIPDPGVKKAPDPGSRSTTLPSTAESSIAPCCVAGGQPPHQQRVQPLATSYELLQEEVHLLDRVVLTLLLQNFCGLGFPISSKKIISRKTKQDVADHCFVGIPPVSQIKNLAEFQGVGE
jgi:hypothetical protein